MAEKEIAELQQITAVLGRRIKTKTPGISDWGMYIYRTSDVGNLPTSIKVFDGKADITIVGTDLPEIEGVPIRFYGKWQNRKEYGYRFAAEAFEVLNPTTVSGMIKLFTSRFFPGVGETSARKLASIFGLDTFDVIQNDDVRLIKAIPLSVCGLIQHYYKRMQKFGTFSGFLYQYGFSHTMTTRILRVLGDNAEEIVKANPYSLLQVRGIGFQTCDRLARGLGVALDAYERVEGGITESITELCSNGGHMYVDLSDLRSHALKKLNSGFDVDPVDTKRFDEVLSSLTDAEKVVQYKYKSGRTDVYLKSYENAEVNSVKKLMFLLNNPIDPKKVKACGNILDAYCEKAGIKLHPTQRDAVIRSISNRVSIITGGPGTGKTTIISAILACYEELFGKDILLMAPTGKAARRMSESTKRDASTIHSRLHLYATDGTQQDPEPIQKGLIVVDESSMVDNFLMENLMAAIDSPECHLIFCGDIDQLPSVGSGAVLGEMIQSGVIPTSRLTETFRQKGGGALIIENAKKVNTGKTDLEYDETFEFVEASGDEDAANKILDIYKEEIQKWGIENVALLCPLRGTQNGRFQCVADAMNERLQDIVNPASPEKDMVTLFGNKRKYRVGDRVMQWQNTKDSANGDIGEIVAISNTGGEIAVSIKWESGITSVCTREDMSSIKMAYAMSIHKSQGSEYLSVIIPVVSAQSCQLFKRNLLYTGITRAKKKVILVGDPQGINACIAQSDTNIRNTHLAGRLRKWNAANN